MSVLIANNATTILASGISAGATSIPLNPGTGVLFPNPVSPDFFYATIQSASNPALLEIVLVTARSTDTLTVVRGQDGTTAQAFSASDIFALLPTRATDNAVRNVISLPTTTGSANAQTAINTVPLAVLSKGACQSVILGFSNTGPWTFAPDGLAPAAVFVNSSACVGGEGQAGATADLIYNGSHWDMVNPAVSSKNFFLDPCCRVAQIGSSAAFTLTTAYKYGVVDLVSAKATGTTVSAGTITQDTVGTIASAATPYAVKLAGVTITGLGKVFFRKWVQAQDAIAFVNGYGIFGLWCRHDVGSTINAFLTANAWQNPNAPGTPVQIATGSGSPVSVPTGTDTFVTLAVPNMSVSGTVANGFELILEMDCGTVTTKNFYATDWQACLKTLSQRCVIPRFSDDYISALDWYEQTYEYGTAPATITINGAIQVVLTATITTANFLWGLPLQSKKVVTPTTIAVYSPTTGTANRVNRSGGGGDFTVTILADTAAYRIQNNSGGTTTAAAYTAHYTVDSRP